MKSRAFSLVELLVVIAIIAIICAILFPALSRAREFSYSAVRLSNLHQMALSAEMYVQDNGGQSRDLPPRTYFLRPSITKISCDPEDTWRTQCKGDWGTPMAGSFGYFPAAIALPDGSVIPELSDLFDQRPSDLPLFISIFGQTQVIDPFHGVEPKGRMGRAYGPKFLTISYYNGHAAVKPNKVSPDIEFNWMIIFSQN